MILPISSAQSKNPDVIVTKKGETIEAKVTDVGIDEIKYKKFDYIDGPSYTLKNCEIATVVFSNGKIQTFDCKQSTSQGSNKNATTSNNEAVNVKYKESCGLQLMPELKGFYTWSDAVSKCPDGWRLPTKDELKCLCGEQWLIGGFTLESYWTDSEQRRVTFDDCKVVKSKKKNRYGVRYVRNINK